MATTSFSAGLCDCLDALHLLGRAAPNVGDVERLASVASGAGLLLWSLRHCSVSGLVVGSVGAGLLYRGLTGHCHVYQALGNSTRKSEHAGVPAQVGLRFERTLFVNCAAKDLFEHWRHFENLAEIMPNIAQVRDLGNGRSHWVADGPLGVKLEWDAEVHNEEAGRLIAWRSLPGGDIETAGSVHFDEHPSGQGADLHLSLKYNPPLGTVGGGLAWFLGQGIEHQIERNLLAFKDRTESTARPPSHEGPLVKASSNNLDGDEQNKGGVDRHEDAVG